MNSSRQDKLLASIEKLDLPAYREIPDVGLYLEQTAKYITDCLSPLQESPVTGSMISNYVKKGLISSPVRKQYNREQIAQLIFIAVGKMVMSMEDLHLLLSIQHATYPCQIAYDYFRTEFSGVLAGVFSGRHEIEALQDNASDEKIMLRNMIIAVAYKVYMDKLVLILRSETPCGKA